MRKNALLPVLLFLVAGVWPSLAQPQLNITRVVNTWPTIDLHFSVTCNGTPAYFTDTRHFRVLENGVEITRFDLWCPDPTSRNTMSAALVLDASGSMAGWGNAAAKAFGNGFVDAMDGVADEAAVLWFNDDVTTRQRMTTSKDMLHAAVNDLPASGNTAMWDGIYAGLLEVITNSAKPARIVIVLSDGADASSTRNSAEVVALATRNRLRVFTVGLGAAVDSTSMKNVATLTGGRYYTLKDAASTTAILYDLWTLITTGFGDCFITYDAQCMDGSTRRVDLTLQNFCGGSDTKTATYKTPRDTSTFTPLRMGIGSVEAPGSNIVAVPLLLLDSIAAPALFHPSEFLVNYDPSLLTFLHLDTPSGSLFQGVPIKATPVMDGIAFESQDPVMLQARQAPALLAMLYFRTRDVHGGDTLVASLQLAKWSFTSGCFRPQLSDGHISIMPSVPELSCSVQAPAALAWDTVAHDYAPNPFTVTATVTNAGFALFRNAQFIIACSPHDARLVSPSEPSQVGTPADLPPQGSSQAQWTLRAQPHGAADTVSITIIAAFANRAEYVVCPVSVVLPSAGAALGCILQAEKVVVHSDKQQWNPMPFTVTATVRNAGGVTTDSARATIVLPPGLSLAWPDAPGDSVKRVDTGALAPLEYGAATWHVSAPPSEHDSTYRIRVVSRSSLTDPAECAVDVMLPGLGPLRSRLYITRDTIDFGNVVPGTSSSGVLALGNTGALALHCSGVAIRGTDASLFTFSQPFPDSFSTGTYGGAFLLFSPLSYGPKAAELQFATDDPDRPVVTVALIGRGQGAPRLAVDSIVDFGDVRSSDTRDTTLELRSTGEGDLRLLTQSIGGGDATEFRVVIPAASTIAAGQSSRMTLRFQPSGSGRKTSSLMLASNDTLHPVRMVTLTGNAEPVDVQHPRALPDSPQLHANRPNPFSTFTVLAMTLPAAGHARLAVVDALGREVALLHEGAAMAGTTTCRFDAGALPEGLYFAVLRCGNRIQALPMVKVGNP